MESYVEDCTACNIGRSCPSKRPNMYLENSRYPFKHVMLITHMLPHRGDHSELQGIQTRFKSVQVNLCSCAESVRWTLESS